MYRSQLKSLCILILLVISLLTVSVIYALPKNSRYVLHIESLGNKSKFMVFVNGKLAFEASEGLLSQEITSDIIIKGKNKVRIVIENKKGTLASFRLVLMKDVAPFSGMPFIFGKEDEVLVNMNLSGKKAPEEDVLTDVKEFLVK